MGSSSYDALGGSVPRKDSAAAASNLLLPSSRYPHDELVRLMQQCLRDLGFT